MLKVFIVPVKNFRKSTMSALRIGILSTFALDFFTTLSIAIVAVFLGLRLINEEILLFPALTVLILLQTISHQFVIFQVIIMQLDGKNAFQAIQSILSKIVLKSDQVTLKSWSQNSRLDLEKH